MIFKCNTRPVVESSKLAILNANVSPFHKKSCVVSISADTTALKINVEANRIMTEVSIPGHGEGDPASIFVDSMQFKNLMNTLVSEVVDFEFTDNALIVKSGKSQFSLAKMVDADDMSFTSPAAVSGESIPIDANMWSFVSNNQDYALSKAFVHPVYTYVRVTADGKVYTGDFDSSLFTESSQSPFIDCLLSDTIINLLTSLPDNSMAYKVGKDIVIAFTQDSYSYRSEIQPMYETDPDVGEYGVSAISPLMVPNENYGTIERSKLQKLLSQANLLSTSSDETIKLTANGDVISLKNNTVDATIDSEHHIDTPFEGEFNLSSLNSVVSHMVDDKMTISATMNDGQISGMLFWDTHMATVLGVIAE